MKTIFTLLLLLANFSFCISQTKIVTKEKPLFVVNDKIISEAEFQEINPNLVDSIAVLKDKNAMAKYGKKGKNGVIEAYTKKPMFSIPKKE